MDCAVLQGLSRDELIELVVRLSEMVAVVGRLQEQVDELKQRVAELEAEAAQPGAPAKTAENSSVPPSA